MMFTVMLLPAAWILCSGKEYEQCLALLDAVKEPWPDTLHPSVELMCGICHFHLVCTVPSSRHVSNCFLVNLID